MVQSDTVTGPWIDLGELGVEEGVVHRGERGRRHVVRHDGDAALPPTSTSGPCAASASRAASLGIAKPMLWQSGSFTSDMKLRLISSWM